VGKGRSPLCLTGVLNLPENGRNEFFTLKMSTTNLKKTQRIVEKFVVCKKFVVLNLGVKIWG